jgi:hypothetical protein
MFERRTISGALLRSSQSPFDDRVLVAPWLQERRCERKASDHLGLIILSRPSTRPLQFQKSSGGPQLQLDF